MAKIAQQGYRVLQSTDFIDEVTLDGLPKAEVASDGSLRVPTIKAADYQRLLARLTPEAQGPQVAKPVAPGKLPEPWASLAVGQLVLGCRLDIEEGWYESIVVAVKDDVVTLRLRDYPREPKYTAKKSAIGLILT